MVVDRLAKLESSILANRQVVRSDEGRELSSLLERHQKGARRNFVTSDVRLTADDARSSGMRPADDPVLPDDPMTLSVMVGASLEERSEEFGAEFESQSNQDYPELELIVVEDDPPDSPPPPSMSPRREGVQQLFTRLRRG